MTNLQGKFVELVLQGLEPKEAARQAGYRGRSAPWRLMADPEVIAALKLGREGKLVSSENVLLELGRIAMGEASDENGAALKMGSKLRALEVLAKVLGMYDRGVGGDGEVVIVEDVGM